MTGLTFELRSVPPGIVDGSVLQPAALAGKSRAEIERLPLAAWNETLVVADLFALKGRDAQHVTIHGACDRFERLGAGLDGGTLTVVGGVGRYAGEGMRRGTLIIDGPAASHVGAGMRGGLIDVTGDAGDFAGSARPGAMAGMAGGTLRIRGDAGDRAGDRMRRGTLIVEGAVGGWCVSRMIAGTALVLGAVGPHPGHQMRRGTLLLDAPGCELLPTFNPNGRHDLLAIRLLLDSLAAHGPGVADYGRRAIGGLDRWLGDLAAGGQGEIFVARS
ncbi:MAG: formylmethanofuran dehydrogenase subunit C [Burkholderiales bacterium]|nr:formylmethanofuran dehydrogenase subunit C [Burkholderiales bacterium]